MLFWKPNWFNFDTVAWNNLFMEFALPLLFILKMSQNFSKHFTRNPFHVLLLAYHTQQSAWKSLKSRSTQAVKHLLFTHTLTDSRSAFERVQLESWSYNLIKCLNAGLTHISFLPSNGSNFEIEVDSHLDFGNPAEIELVYCQAVRLLSSVIDNTNPIMLSSNTLWRIRPLLGSDRETSNKTTTIAKQQLRKYATVQEPSLGNVCTQQWRNVWSGVFFTIRAGIM
jgi:hypothetical protein